MARILVPDYPGQQVIAGIKSLAIEGDTCDLAWNQNVAERLLKSKYIHRSIKIPAANQDPVGYKEQLVALLKAEPYDMIMPFGNDAFHHATAIQDEIKKHAHFLCPRDQEHQIAYDKYLTYLHCQKIDIPTPRTYVISNQNDLTARNLEVGFPLIIKSRIGSGVETGLRIVDNPSKLESCFNEIQNRNNNEDSKPALLIMQEFIPGQIHDACLVADKGKIQAILTQVRHWMYPPSGGVGAINYTTINHDLMLLAEKLIASLNWSGPAQIEFKLDERDKQFKLIEINPKLWGTLDLSIKSGVDFTVIIRDINLGRQINRPSYEVGNYYFFLFPQTTISFFQGLFWKRPQMKVSKPKIHRRFFDIDLSDPGPLLIRIGKTLYLLISNLVRLFKR